MMMNADALIHEIMQIASPEKAIGMCRFFKTGKGEYAENDRFLGVNNPSCRELVRQYSGLPVSEVKRLMFDQWHEVRLCGLLIAVKQYDRSDDPDFHKRIMDLYCEAADSDRINNWDLVDLSAPGIMGNHEFRYRNGVPEIFSRSGTLWKERIAIVSTLYLIRKREFKLTLDFVRRFLNHKHDLMHKACGWMLREVGKQDQDTLTAFLEKYRRKMPRTMLRYAIERYPEEQRQAFLKK